MAADRPSLGTFALRVLVAVLIVALALVLWRIRGAFLLAFAAALRAVLIGAAARPLARLTGLPRSAAIAAIVALVVAVLGVVLWLAEARIGAQFADLADRLPGGWAALRQQIGATEFGARLLHRSGEAMAAAGDVLAGAADVASSAFGAVTNAILIIAGSVYLALQPETYRSGVVQLAPAAA